VGVGLFKLFGVVCLVAGLSAAWATVAPEGIGAAAGMSNPSPALENALEPAPSAAVPGEILVRFRSAEGRTRQQPTLQSMAQRVKVFGRSARPSLQRLSHSGVQSDSSLLDQLALIKLSGDGEVAAALRRLRTNGDVLYAELNYRLHLAESNPATVPDDFEFAQLWAMQNTGQTGGKAGADISATQAWGLSTGDQRVVVAVLDTGVDYFHPDLSGNMWINVAEVEGNGLDDDGNGYIDDVHGYDFVSQDGDPMDDNNHGTHVAGTIGAVADNRIGVAGVCWHVNLMALKAFDEAGNGDVATAIEAIHYAVANGARVINASWGGTDRSLALEEAIAEAHQAGVVFVASAGNNSSDKLLYPAACPHVVAVAASDQNDQRSSFSNYGSFVALAAPGENILSTFPNDSYGVLSGTSMAAPHASGVAALILARHPEFTNDQVASILRNTADPIGADLYIGSGRLNAFHALLVDAPLPEVQLSLPDTVFGIIDIGGIVRAVDLASYSLAFGAGENPTNWTEFHTADRAVTNGVLLAGFSTRILPDGMGTIRLTARNQKGQSASARAVVKVSNVSITSPFNNDTFRAGDPIEIRGTVFGSNLTYTIEHGLGWRPANWSADGITLVNQGAQQVVDSVLAYWDTRAAGTNAFYALKLTATAPDQTVYVYQVQLIYLDGLLRPGWPQRIALTGSHPTEDWRNVIVADLDADGADELILVDHGDGDGKPARLLVFRADGRLWWSRELATGPPYADLPVVGDIDGDGFLEVFTDVGDKLFAFGRDGAPLAGQWPVTLQATGLGKVIADLRGDGNRELVTLSQNAVSAGTGWGRRLTVFDKSGAVIQSWQLPSCSTSIDAQKILPAVGNLDSSSDQDIVVPMDCYTLAAFNLRTINGPIWTTFHATQIDGQLLSSAAIGDLDNDGHNEIVIAAYDEKEHGGTHGGIYVFDGQGKLRPGWPVLVEESFSAPPALADFDDDGLLEISIPSWSSRRVHLIRHTGFEVDGWPVEPGGGTTAKSSTVIGDINGDGRLDVVMVSPGSWQQTMMTGDLSRVGGVKAWNYDGTRARWPGGQETLPLVMEATGGIGSLKAGVVTLADIDHRGRLNVIAASIQDSAYFSTYPTVVQNNRSSVWIERKNRSSLYVWELGAAFTPARFPWPTYQNNPQHTGQLSPPSYVDQPPVVLAMPDQTVKAGTSYFPIELDRYVEDPDDPAARLVWTIAGNVALKAIIDDQRVVTILPPSPDWTGKETLTFTARDPAGLESSATAVFEARRDYNPPLAVQDVASTLENVPVEIDVLANDTNPQGGKLVVLQLSRPEFGAVQRTDRGTVLYTPDADRNGTDSFTYSISDGLGGLAIGWVSVEVIPVNTKPKALPDQAITLENEPAEVDVLANDKDPDGDSLTLVGFTQPVHGTVRTNALGRLVYTPVSAFHGLDEFNYTVSDGHGLEDTGTVSVMVKAVNQPPVAANQTFTFNRNRSQVVNFSATDPDGDPLTYTVVQAPKQGQLFAYPATATYYPNKNFVGTDSFTYTANDGQYDSNEATVTLYVTDANNPPVARSQFKATKPNQPMPVRLSATDDDDDPLSFFVLTQPTHGTLTGSGTNYIYRPDPGYLGDDQFQYQASDGRAFSEPATVSIKVTEVNTAPAADSLSVETPVNTPLSVTLPASDGESDRLTFEVMSSPRHGRLDGPLPDLTYLPSAGFFGPDRFTFKANDGELDSNVATVSIRVQYPNHAPVATNQTVNGAKDQARAFSLDVTDADGDPLRCVILKGPRHGRLAGRGILYTYIPTAGFVGGDSFTYKAWDGHAYSNTGEVVIDVPQVPSTGGPAIQSLEPLNNGQVRLLVKAPPGSSLELQASSDLLNWVPLETQTATGDTVSFNDAQAADFQQRFYRVLRR